MPGKLLDGSRPKPRRGNRGQGARVKFALLALAFASACNPASHEKWVATQQDILKGQLSGPNEDMTVKVESVDAANGTIWNCSGTLVAPNLLVTARHCIAAFVEQTFTCDADGNLVSSGPGGRTGALDDPTQISVKPGTTASIKAVAKGVSIFEATTDSICRNDIAFVLLNRALDQAPYNLPIAPLRLFTGVQPGEDMRVVGYGIDDDAGFNVRHTRGGLTVSKIGSSVLRPAGDNIPPRTFTIDGPVACIGDSGGPAFSDTGAVVGVFSQFVGDCTSALTVNYFTEVAPFWGDIVQRAFTASGYEPWLEGNSEPGLYGTGGAAGTGGDTSTGGAPLTGGASSIVAAGGAAGSTTTSAAGGTSNDPVGGSSSGTVAATTNVSGGGASGNASGGNSGSSSGGTQGALTAIGGTLATTGGASQATGGDTLEPIIYDKGPSSGGSCACRFSGKRRGSLGLLLIGAGLLGARRRRQQRA